MLKPILLALALLAIDTLPAEARGREVVHQNGANSCLKDVSRSNDNYVRFRNGCRERIIVGYGNLPREEEIGCRSSRLGTSFTCATEIAPGDTLIANMRPGTDYYYRVCTSASWAAGKCRVDNENADRRAAAAARQRQQEQQRQQSAAPPKSSGGGTVLSGSALAAKIGGQRFWVRPNNGGATYQARFVPGGEFVIGNNGQVSGRGRWWIDGNQICTQVRGRAGTFCHVFTDVGGGQFRSNNGTVIWYR